MEKRIKTRRLWLSSEEERRLKQKSAELGLSSNDYLRKCINEQVIFCDKNLKSFLDTITFNSKPL